MEKDKPAPITLPAHRVHVTESGRSSRSHWIRCGIDNDLRFDTSGLEAYCLTRWEPRVYDALVLAAAVQFCDHTKRRHAAAWGRQLALRLPVHAPELWNSPRVSSPLHDTLNFLTGDQWEITFEPRCAPISHPRQDRFDLPGSEAVVMPYSDGLDSCAVGGLMEKEYGRNLVRVRLGLKACSQQQNGRTFQPFAMLPYRVSYGKRVSVEASGRTRGFRFALLGGIAAYLLEARKILVAESGQGAIGPALVPVGQAYEDYRNHPLFTWRMEKFLAALFDHKVTYIYPRLWHTKGETLTDFLHIFPKDTTWELTRSCWQRQRQTSVGGTMRQCGVCAACMLRRMSVHASGRQEPSTTYVWENLRATTYKNGAAPDFRRRMPKGNLYEYAIAGILHLAHLAGLRGWPGGRSTIHRQGFQLSRALNISEDEVRVNLERLLGQHEAEWNSFVKSLGSDSFIANWA